MAGTARAAATTAGLGLDAQADVFSQRIGLPFKQWDNAGAPDLYEPFPLLAAGGARTADSSGGTVAVETARAASADEVDSLAYPDWWDQIHLLPRSEIEFGNIITQIERNLELYNAFRDTDKTLASITNNITPGIEFPGITPPVVVPRQTSLLGASTTGNNAGTGLGTIVEEVVRATQQGLPSFDGTVVFVFTDANDPVLTASGTRLVLIPFEYESDLNETLSFLTDVVEALDGREQRIALRKHPRQRFSVEYRLFGTDRRRMSALLFDWQAKSFGFPLWHEQVKTTAAVSVGATSYPISGGDLVDFRVGGLAAIVTDSNTFDVINVDAVSATSITAADPSVYAYPAGTPIMPVRIAVLTGSVPSSRAIVNLETFRATFDVADNATGALSGSTTPGSWSIYNSRVLFDDCNVVDGPMRTERLTRVFRIDNETGTFEVTSPWGRNKVEMLKGFSCRSRAEILALRRLWIAIRGRQKAFYLPTFIEEIVAVDDLTIGTDTIDIEAIGYPIYAQERSPFNLLRVAFTDGTELIRTVQSSADVDDDTERLTLDSNWPANRTVDEIERIDFYELVRSMADQLRLRYQRAGRATARLPVIRVFDDDA